MSIKISIRQEIKELYRLGWNITYIDAIAAKQLTKTQVESLEKDKDFVEYQKKKIDSNSAYQSWYSKACAVVKQLLPSRYDEFQKLYYNEKRNLKDITILTYTIADYFLGIRITQGRDEAFSPFKAFYSKMQVQLQILNACIEALDSRLMDMEGVLQSELFETELDTAKDILKKKHIRLAGALAGITLESHLKKVCVNRDIKLKKKHPTISDFNEELRKGDFIDIPTWRLIQRLGDIRNMSVHSKEREPSNDEVEDLIRGTEKLIAELY